MSLRFRKLEKKDLPLLYELKRESHCGTHHLTIISSYDQECWFETLDHHPHHPNQLWLIAEKDDKPVGVFKLLNIDWVNRQADVAWDIFKELRGKGLGNLLVKCGTRFAFQGLNFWRLNAEILENNIASQKCAAAAGWVKEGCKRKAIFKDNAYIDSWVYGILADES